MATNKLPILLITDRLTKQVTQYITTLLLVLIFVSGYSQAENYYGPVTISFHGFICTKPTNDDPFGMDGVGDEVSVHFWDMVTVSGNWVHYNGMEKISFPIIFVLKPERLQLMVYKVSCYIQLPFLLKAWHKD